MDACILGASPKRAVQGRDQIPAATDSFNTEITNIKESSLTCQNLSALFRKSYSKKNGYSSIAMF